MNIFLATSLPPSPRWAQFLGRVFFWIALMTLSPLTTSHAQDAPVAIVIHGGAGTIERAQMTPAREAEYRAALKDAVTRGHALLAKGGSALDAVEAAVMTMEDDPLFNAGKGAVFTHDGKNELDAAIMDGKTLKAGAVAGVSHIQNPVKLARLVMEKSPHVLLTGAGAEQFATEQGMALVDPAYFWTKTRWQQLERARKRADAGNLPLVPDQIGTVGAVALDRDGNLAAATSTGGMTNKLYGRIGDSPIIGAGTYASNLSAAVSATGVGEFFIRGTIARDIAALMEMAHLTLTEAANQTIHGKLTNMGGSGGIIALDREGNIATPFNTEGMYRASIDKGGKLRIAIFSE
jgi:beta-aspartyl-peptidase (threonine type)